MGIHGFKLSDMIPNSWFYKLKDMGTKSSSRNNGSRLKKTEQEQQQGRRAQTPHQNSVSIIYDNPNSSVSPSDLKLFDTGYFPVPSLSRRLTRHRRVNPRKSRKKKPPRLVMSSVSSGCGCRATLDSVWVKTEPVSLPGTEFSVSHSSDSDSSSSVDQPLWLPPSFDQMVSWSASRSSNDIVIDLGKSSPEPDIEFPSEMPLKFTDMVKNVRRQQEDQVPAVKKSSVRGFAVNPPGVRMRINSNSTRTGPRKRTKGSHRKSGSVSGSPSTISWPGNRRTSVLESVAIVKCSADPRRDFRESMIEMIVENNIRESRDLEELLACYLCLNSGSLCSCCGNFHSHGMGKQVGMGTRQGGPGIWITMLTNLRACSSH